MAVSYGFFDSQNGDRKYNAQQMTEFYSGIVTNGVFQHVSNGLAVSAGTGLNVSVAAGRAIVQNHWVKNDAALTVAIPAASATYARIDAIVIRYSSANRNITITVKEGTAAASPVAPSMTRDGSTYEMALAYVNVPKNASSVTVTDKRSDSAVCGWAAVAQATSGEVDAQLNAMKTGFDGVTYASPAAMVQGCDEKVEAYAAARVDSISAGTYNLAKIVDKSGTKNNVPYSMKNGVFIASGTASAQTDFEFDFESTITFSAGKYTIGFYGAYSNTNTFYIYFRNGTSYSSPYYVSNSSQQTLISLSNDLIADGIMFRTSSGSVMNIQAIFQVASGYDNMPINPFSAYDANANNSIWKMINTKIIPVFTNGGISSGQVSRSNVTEFNTHIVTEKVYKIKKGSYICPSSNDNPYLYMAKFNDDGTFNSYIYNGVLDHQVYFSEDTNIRFCMRAQDRRNLIPTFAENITFELYGADAQTTETGCWFYSNGRIEGSLSGQMQFVKTSDGKNIILDSHLASYYNWVHNVLVSFGIRRIDYCVLSHYHGDHVGIINCLDLHPEWFNITGSTWFLPQHLTSDDLQYIDATERTNILERQSKLESILENNNCVIIRPTEGQAFSVNDEISLKFYNCDHSDYFDPESEYFSTNYNDFSLCCYLSYGLNNINFSADIGPIGQRKVGGTLEKATILTAPHHGWDNGANNLIPAFINNVNPDVVISVNGWEHNPENTDSPANIMNASSAMQSYCEANSVPNYPTCINGPIKINMYNYGWKFDGNYTRFIRNNKNWSYTDNSEHIEN